MARAEQTPFDDRGEPAAGARERRRDPRVQILGDLHGEIVVFQPMTLRTVSRGGAELQTAFPLQIDSLHDLRLTLGDRSVVVKGRVVYCISDVDQEAVAYRSGIEFVEPSERVGDVIAHFVEAIRGGRRSS